VKAPWRDFAGTDIYEGDVLIHPSGERGKVVYLPYKDDDHTRWRVDYGDGGPYSSLGLQIGDKGRAVVIENASRVITRDKHEEAPQ